MDIALEISNKIKDFGDIGNITGIYGVVESILTKYIISPIDTSYKNNEKTLDVINYYLDCKISESNTKGTINGYRRNLYSFSKCINSDFYSININEIRTYIVSMNNKYKNSTIRNKVEIIKCFFIWCNYEGYINNLPSKIIVPKQDNNLRIPLTIGQLELVRKHCRTHRERALLEILLSTGCRVSELRYAKRNEVLSGSFIVSGKGKKERVAYINEKAMFHIKEYLDTRKDDSEYLFITQKGNINSLSIRCIQKELSKIGKRANIHLFPHRMRHTFSTNLLRSGADIVTIQSLLGHSSLNTTQIYSKTDVETVKFEHYKYSTI